jgi:hypothetical protein
VLSLLYKLLSSFKHEEINKENSIRIIVLFLALSSLVNAQNVEFKASNFKADKEGFKKAEAAIEFGDIYFF